MRNEWYIVIILVMLFALTGELYDSFAGETRAERVHALLIERGYAKYHFNNSEIMWGETDLMYIITGSLDYTWRSYAQL